jgi:Copper type II ascorbate-dependent monooxygenase, C-terminal domain
MFTQAGPTAAGTVTPNVTGTTLFEGAELIAGWAIGGCSTTYPEDVGVTLPDSGTIMVQWHHFNTTGMPQQDGSSVQVCTLPAGSRMHVAGLTFLGTESLAIPPGKADATSTCKNDSGAPITIIGFTPHMHTIGSNMRSVVDKAGGGSMEIFNKPFVFDQQINYMLDPPYVLQPGDSITTTCTYSNNTPVPVTFGQSTTQEMCYQFTLSYPYGALNNGVVSLIGATNTCW